MADKVISSAGSYGCAFGRLGEDVDALRIGASPQH
jgi:hypothetical protein